MAYILQVCYTKKASIIHKAEAPLKWELGYKLSAAQPKTSRMQNSFSCFADVCIFLMETFAQIQKRCSTFVQILNISYFFQMLKYFQYQYAICIPLRSVNTMPLSKHCSLFEIPDLPDNSNTGLTNQVSVFRQPIIIIVQFLSCQLTRNYTKNILYKCLVHHCIEKYVVKKWILS